MVASLGGSLPIHPRFIPSPPSPLFPLAFCIGIVRGKMEVGFLPPHLAQGMFKNPGTYDLAMRYSTETTAMIEDTIPQPRGIGMKVFGIEGKKLRQDMKDPKTQDWEFNNASALELGSARVSRLRLKED